MDSGAQSISDSSEPDSWVVVALSSGTGEIAVFQPFGSELEASEFVKADQFPPQFDKLALVRPLHVVKDP